MLVDGEFGIHVRSAPTTDSWISKACFLIDDDIGLFAAGSGAMPDLAWKEQQGHCKRGERTFSASSAAAARNLSCTSIDCSMLDELTHPYAI